MQISVLAFFKALARYRDLFSVPKEELALDEEEVLMQQITSWSKDLSNLPPISHSSLYKYLVEGIVNVDERSRGAMKHKIQGYQLFKEHYVKKVSVKDNVVWL